MLNPKLRYLCFDFETTGLDISKNEPMQMGLVIADASGKVIDSYLSLIKPQRPLSELKDIVGYITGLSVEDLAQAPDIHTVIDQVRHFFTPDTVIIGHNIGFDLGMLRKYRQDIPYHSIVDTFPLSQTLLQRKDTYALDALCQDLLLQDDFQTIKSLVFDTTVDIEGFHDALQDSRASLGLFLYCLKRLTGLIKDYPYLHHFLLKADSPRSDLLTAPTEKISKVSLPPLSVSLNKKSAPEPTEYYDFASFKNKHLFYGNIPLKDFLRKAVDPAKKTLLAFSHKIKVDIVKKILQELGHHDITFSGEDTMIDRDMLDMFAYKGHYSQEEIGFLIKYLSHVQQGYSILQLSSPADRYIYHLITQPKEKKLSNLILTHHNALYTSLEKKDYQDYEILFCDSDRRYDSYNNYSTRPIDPYTLLGDLEQLVYTFKTLQDIDGTHQYEDLLFVLNQATQSLAVFIGILFIDITQHFTGVDKTSLQAMDIKEDISFFKSMSMRARTSSILTNLLSLLPDDHSERVAQHFGSLDYVFEHPITIQKKMYSGDKFYYIFAETVTYTDFSEFIQKFDGYTSYFLSNHNHQNLPLEPRSSLPQTNQPIAANGPKDVIGILEKNNFETIFVLSTAKQQSQYLFTSLYEAGYHKDYSLLVENLTGGFGKNMRLAQNTGKKIIIGGYNFALAVWKFNVKVDATLIYHLSWPLKPAILSDIAYYTK